MVKFDWLRPEWLWLLALLPVIWLVLGISWNKFFSFLKSLEKKPYFYSVYLPPWRQRIVKAVFFSLALILLVLALADPYYSQPVKYNIYRDIRLYFLADISRSMQMAEDLSPNRLAAMKSGIGDFVRSLDGAYDISLIPFAGGANPYYHPPADDFPSFLLALDYLDSQAVSTLGTNLEAALAALNDQVALFGADGKNLNLVIILSDGGREESIFVDRSKLLAQIHSLKTSNFRFYAIGIGNKESTRLVRRDWAGNFLGYLKRADGQVHASVLDEGILKFIAQSGRGDYFHFSRQDELAIILKKIIDDNKKLDRTEIIYQKQSLRTPFFIAGILILLLFKKSFRLTRKPAI